MYHETEMVDDFVSVRVQRTDRDAFQEALSPMFLSIIVRIERKFEQFIHSKVIQSFEQWFRSKVIRSHPD